LEIPDADVLKNLLERQNVQDCTWMHMIDHDST
jgi:hypothetical protein